MLSVYKMELYKMIRRRNSLLLLIPCALSILMTVGFQAGALELAAAEGDALLSCLDFTTIIWIFLRSLGIMSIIILLVGAFQFAGEVEQGQIKIFLLRVRRRRDIIIGKALAILSFVLAFIALFWGTTIAAYMLILGEGELTSGTFDFAAYAFYDIPSILFSLLGTVLTFFMLILITFCLGTKFSMFFSFITGLIIMYGGSFLAGMERMKFMQVTPFYMEELILTDATAGAILACLIGSVVIIAAILMLTIRIFNHTDIK